MSSAFLNTTALQFAVEREMERERERERVLLTVCVCHDYMICAAFLSSVMVKTSIRPSVSL